MTPIGHFACASAVAGTVDLTTGRETALCLSYYLLFLLVFSALTIFLPPGAWAMHLHDTFGNAALLFFLIFWNRKEDRKSYFVCLLIGGQILSAYTHVFDSILLNITGSIPEGMWRPHNIFHTPFAAVAIPLIVLPLVRLAMGRISFKGAFFYLSLGYFLHIVADTLTYNYQIYPFWPASSFHFSLASFFQQPDASGRFLGSPLYVFSEPNAANIDGFIVYRAELAVNLLLAALFFVKGASVRILKREF
ncbi:MAG: hypothetical protein V2A66_09775 [Pseudomonadota bacterium]